MEILDIVLKWAIPFILTAVCGFLIGLYKQAMKQDKSIKDGICCLLRAEIIRDNEKYVAKGYCPIYAREALERGYTAYHNLGGNDVATGLYNEVMQLPTTPKG